LRELGHARAEAHPPRRPRDPARARVRRGLDGPEGARRLRVRRENRQARRHRSDGRHPCAAGRNGRNERYPRRRGPRSVRFRLMATTEEAPATEQTPVAWYALPPDEVTSRIGVDPAKGLTGAEAASRLASYGPNKFTVAKVEPRWHA